MKTSGRYVFDTNVLISAILFEHSKPDTALEPGAIVLSYAVIQELNTVLSREKFNRYVFQEEREHFLEALLREAIVVDILEVVRACCNPKDDMYLELAVSGAQILRRGLRIKTGRVAHRIVLLSLA
jgi:hypothetical protein